jgi:hypothetical protein
VGVGALKRCVGTVVALVAAFLLMGRGPSAIAMPSSPKLEETPLDLVLLVDESGSLSNADVAHEIQAAGTIAQTPLNPRSRVTVVGFGGINGLAPHQDPTSVVCQPTITTGASSLEYLARCVRALHRRTEAEGDDTDYAAALAQALEYLSPDTTYGRQSPAGATKAIFLMTDGGLDVHRDPQYTSTGNWLLAAHHAVNLQLAAARAADVQVWTLGFGTISGSNAQYLQYLATQGARAACDSRKASEPRSIIAPDSAIALDALYSLYAAAGCAGVSHVSTVLPAGQTRVLKVRIPAIASAGAISVDKVNPAIGVDFLTPDGTTVTGAPLDGSTFQSSGSDTAVEVLHIANPAPGLWQIRLTAPPNMHRQLVTATVFWQGAVRVSIFPAPTSARVGQPIQVTVSVLGPNGPITNPASLNGIDVQVGVSGDGLTGTTNVPVSNSGEGPGTSTGVGDYRGTFTAPKNPGTLTFTGTASGYGLHATQVFAPVQVSTVAALLQGTVQFAGAPQSVNAGQDLRGHVIFANQTGSSQGVRITLTADHAFATIADPRGVLRIPSGRSEIAFTIAVSNNSPRGTALLTVRAVDANHGQIAYGTAPLLITVLSPPGIFGKYRWDILAAAVLLILLILGAYVRNNAHRAAVDVRGLYVMLRRGDDPVGPELKAPGRWSDTFRFVIRNDPVDGARLDTPKTGDRPFSAKRKLARGRRTDLISVITDNGEKHDLGVGTSNLGLDNGLLLAFRDKRRASPTSAKTKAAPGKSRPPASAPDPIRNPATGQAPDQQAKPTQSASRAPSSFDDPWL